MPEKYNIYDFTALNAKGEKIWCFIGVPVSRSEEFLKKLNQQPCVNIDVTQYGKVLASGKGESTPESVRKEIMAKYYGQQE